MSTSVSTARAAAMLSALANSVPPVASSPGSPARLSPRSKAAASSARHAVGAQRQPAADRLADHHRVGLQPPLLRQAAGRADQRVRLVQQEQRAGRARELAQGVVEAGLGQHDALVGERRLGEHAGVVAAGEGALERAGVVEADHVDVAVGGRRQAEVREPALPGERRQHLVAVAAVVAGEA